MGALGKFSLLAGILFAFLTVATLITALVLTGGVINVNAGRGSLNNWATNLIGNNHLVAQIVFMLFGIDALKGRYLARWWPIPLLAGFIPVASFILEISLNAWPRSLWPLYRILTYTPAIYALGTFLIGYKLQGESNAAESSS